MKPKRVIEARRGFSWPYSNTSRNSSGLDDLPICETLLR
jgi:hypothetical protein